MINNEDKKEALQLFKKLDLVEFVNFRGFNCNQYIYNKFIEGKLQLIDCTFTDVYDQKYKILSQEILKWDTWTTYEKCHQGDLFIDDDENVIFKVYIYKGDMIEGFPTKLKWSAKFKINDQNTIEEILLQFKNDIHYSFENFVKLEFEKEEKLKKEKRMAEIAKKFLES